MMKRVVSLFLVFLLLPAVAGAAEGRMRKLKKANRFFEVSDYANALVIYTELYNSGDSLDSDLNFRIGVCIWEMKKEERKSLPYFLKAAPYETEAHYYLGLLYHLEMRFDEAVKEFLIYRADPLEKDVPDKEIDRHIAICANAQEMMSHPADAEVINLGSGINTHWADYAPLIATDQSKLIFTSRREGSTGGLQDPYGRFYEDIYISYRDSSGRWSAPASLSGNINTATHDACVALDPGGEELIMYRTDARGTGGDLYLTRYDGRDWVAPVILSSEINTEEGWESSATLTADGNTLYFSSNRPGGAGKKDLYCVKKLPNGKWGKAINLGNRINTPYDEDAPFIHPDGKTLYFSSKGLNSMGGFDVFKCSFDEATGNWLAPVNLGYPVNSVDDDICYTTTADGQNSFYSSRRDGGFGQSDIYQVRFPEKSYDFEVVNSLVMTEGDSSRPLSARITLFDLETMKIQGMYRTNKLTGKCILLATPGKRYKVVVEAEGCYPWTEELEFGKTVFLVRLPEKKNKQ